jgi:hypothetical protein
MLGISPRLLPLVPWQEKQVLARTTPDAISAFAGAVDKYAAAASPKKPKNVLLSVMDFTPLWLMYFTFFIVLIKNLMVPIIMKQPFI